MATPPTPTGQSQTRRRADNDIYSVLLIISGVFLAGAVGFLIYRLVTLYGTVFPPAGG
jgi:preprotein translocase subunit Sss1